MAVFLDELFSRLAFGERARGRVAIRLLVARQKSAVTVVDAESVFFPVLVVVGDEAVPLHGAVTVVVRIILVGAIEGADVLHVGDGLLEEIQELVLGVAILTRVLQRELDDLGDVYAPLDRHVVDGDEAGALVLSDCGVYASLSHEGCSFRRESGCGL